MQFKVLSSALTMILPVILSACSGPSLDVGTPANPFIASQLTLEQALENLDPECPSEIKDNQRLITVKYYSFDGFVHQGQMVLDYRLAPEVQEIFDDVILPTRFPIQSVIPVSEFGWDDNASMKANNSSSFNYRNIAGSITLSEHAKGWAVDLNTYLNPFIKGDNIQPAGAVYNPSEPGTLTADNPVVKAFKDHGWSWGGDWPAENPSWPYDYQHFEKDPTVQ